MLNTPQQIHRARKHFKHCSELLKGTIGNIYQKIIFSSSFPALHPACVSSCAGWLIFTQNHFGIIIKHNWCATRRWGVSWLIFCRCPWFNWTSRWPRFQSHLVMVISSWTWAGHSNTSSPALGRFPSSLACILDALCLKSVPWGWSSKSNSASWP